MPKQMNIFEDFENLISNSASNNRCKLHINDDKNVYHNNEGMIHSFPTSLNKLSRKAEINQTISLHNKVRFQIIECNPDSDYYDDYIYLEGNYKKMDGKTGEIINISVTKNGTKLYEILFDEKDITIELYEREFIVIG